MEQATDSAATVAAPTRVVTRALSGVGADVWIGRALLAAALALVLLLGVRHALDQPIYGPIDEAYHTGYVEKIASTGFPPMLGRDLIIIGHHPTFEQGQVRLPEPQQNSAPIPRGYYNEEQQQEAIQPPLYYYVLAPITWFTSGYDRIYGYRIASCVLEAIGILLLYAMLRATLPRMPLAAGIAAVVMGTFTGITQLLSQVQNDAMLVPVCVLLFWAFLHDLEQRRVSWWHGLAAGAVAATQLIVVPLGAATLITAALYGSRGFPRGRELRRLWLPAVLYAAPLGSWVLLNLHRYNTFLPTSQTGPNSVAAHTTTGELLSRSFQLFVGAESMIVQTAYLPLYPFQANDTRPVGLLLVACFVALALVLMRQRPEARTIGLWMILSVVSFVLTFYASIINAGRAGATGEISSIFVARYFVATLAAISATVGITVVSALAGYDWVRRVASVGLCAGLIYFSLTASSIIHG